MGVIKPKMILGVEGVEAPAWGQRPQTPSLTVNCGYLLMCCVVKQLNGGCKILLPCKSMRKKLAIAHIPT